MVANIVCTLDEPMTDEYDRLIAAADHLVRARALMRGDAALAARPSSRPSPATSHP
jgi:hypothetical protein